MTLLQLSKDLLTKATEITNTKAQTRSAPARLVEPWQPITVRE